MLKWIYSLLFLFCAVSVSHAESPPLLIAVDAPYPPFSTLDESGAVRGFDADLIQALCAEMKKQCRLVVMPFNRVIPAVAKGSVHAGIAGLIKTPERERLVDFTLPYYRTRSIFVERSALPSPEGSLTSAAHSPESFAGKRIGVQNGTMQHLYLQEAGFTKLATLVLYPSARDALADLKEGQLDVVLVGGLTGYAYLRAPEGLGLETLGGPVQAPALNPGSCIVVNKKQPHLREQFNEAIRAIRANGIYGKINRKYFDFDIY